MGRFGSIMLIGAVATVASPVVPVPAAIAQTNGDEKCSPSGQVLRYREYPALGIREWSETYRSCDPRSSSRSNNTEDEDRPARRSSREEAPGGGSSGGGRPEDGDEKCGPDGYILKYSWSDYRKTGSWRETARRCSR